MIRMKAVTTQTFASCLSHVMSSDVLGKEESWGVPKFRLGSRKVGACSSIANMEATIYPYVDLVWLM
jgi:hypothetical protein